MVENDAIIFVVDSADRDRLPEFRNHLSWTLQVRASFSIKKPKVPILILANKQDRPGAVGVKELSEVLELRTLLGGFRWHIEPTEAIVGSGLEKGLAWLASELKQESKNQKKVTFS